GRRPHPRRQTSPRDPPGERRQRPPGIRVRPERPKQGPPRQGPSSAAAAKAAQSEVKHVMAIQQQPTSSAGDLTLLQAIEMVAKDKGIDKTRLIKTVEEAILKAAQSVFGINRELAARFNEQTGQVD